MKSAEDEAKSMTAFSSPRRPARWRDGEVTRWRGVENWCQQSRWRGGGSLGSARGVGGEKNQGGRAVPVVVRSLEKQTGAARPLARRGGRREVPAEGKWAREGQGILVAL